MICPTEFNSNIQSRLKQEFNDYLQKAQAGSAQAYLHGTGVELDNKKGLIWLEKSQEAGYIPAHTKYFSLIFYTSDSSSQKIMFKWLNEAAMRGDATHGNRIEINLSRIFQNFFQK